MKNTNDFSKAKVGDKVYYIFIGSGTILSTTHDSEYPILVEFYGGRNTFTADGKMFHNHIYQSLFWSKPEIIAPEKPKTLVTKEIPVKLWFNNDRIVNLILPEGRFLEETSVAQINKECKGTLTYQIEE